MTPIRPGRPLRAPRRMHWDRSLWCLTPRGMEKPRVSAVIGANSSRSRPSYLLLMSVEVEIIGSGGRTPSQAGCGQQQLPTGDRSRVKKKGQS